jgi:hypothetical protein
MEAVVIRRTHCFGGFRTCLFSTWSSFCKQAKARKEVIYASFSNGKYLMGEKFSAQNSLQMDKWRPNKRSDCELPWQHVLQEMAGCVYPC